MSEVEASLVYKSCSRTGTKATWRNFALKKTNKQKQKTKKKGRKKRGGSQKPDVVVYTCNPYCTLWGLGRRLLI